MSNYSCDIHFYQKSNIVKFIKYNNPESELIYFKNINQNSNDLEEIENYYSIIKLIKNYIKNYKIFVSLSFIYHSNGYIEDNTQFFLTLQIALICPKFQKNF